MRRDVFQAIADPTRRAIIQMIAKQPLNLNCVAENFDISRPAISKHVKILAECGLVQLSNRKAANDIVKRNFKSFMKFRNGSNNTVYSGQRNWMLLKTFLPQIHKKATNVISKKKSNENEKRTICN